MVHAEVEINQVNYTDNVIVGNLVSIFRSSADMLHFAVGLVEFYRIPVLVYYTPESGLISLIQFARVGETEHIK